MYSTSTSYKVITVQYRCTAPVISYQPGRHADGDYQSGWKHQGRVRRREPGQDWGTDTEASGPFDRELELEKHIFKIIFQARRPLPRGSGAATGEENNVAKKQ